MNIIIVDDEEYSAQYLEDLCLGLTDILVLGKFQNAYNALEFLQQNPVDAVILDIEMPGLSGIEAIHEMRKLIPQLIVIFVTGYEEYAMDAFRADAVSYLLKPCSREELGHAFEKAGRLLPPSRTRIELRTFGTFSVFIDSVPVHFANSKAKELLALLVDQRGGVVTMEQAILCLWEEHPYDEAVKQLYRKAVIYLKQLFEQRKLSFFVSNRGSCYILPDQASCDYFDFINGVLAAKDKFFGEYLSEYSWGESRLAYLIHLSEDRKH